MEKPRAVHGTEILRNMELSTNKQILADRSNRGELEDPARNDQLVILDEQGRHAFASKMLTYLFGLIGSSGAKNTRENPRP